MTTYDLNEAKAYLQTGGLGEVVGLIDLARLAGQPKVLLDTDLAMALAHFSVDGLSAVECLKRIVFDARADGTAERAGWDAWISLAEQILERVERTDV